MRRRFLSIMDITLKLAIPVGQDYIQHRSVWGHELEVRATNLLGRARWRQRALPVQFFCCHHHRALEHSPAVACADAARTYSTRWPFCHRSDPRGRVEASTCLPDRSPPPVAPSAALPSAIAPTSGPRPRSGERWPCDRRLDQSARGGRARTRLPRALVVQGRSLVGLEGSSMSRAPTWGSWGQRRLATPQGSCPSLLPQEASLAERSPLCLESDQSACDVRGCARHTRSPFQPLLALLVTRRRHGLPRRWAPGAARRRGAWLARACGRSERW